MGCAQGAYDDNCEHEQYYCKINQTASGNNIDITLSTITKNETLVTETIYNRIYTILQNIRDFGARNDGVRHPIIDDLPIVQKNDTILLENYNKILSTIGVNNLTGNQCITKQLIEDLQENLNIYNIDKYRCDHCNTECNTKCENESQGGGDPLCLFTN